MFSIATERWLAALVVVVFWVTLGLSNRAAAQSLSTTWIDLPAPSGDPAEVNRRNLKVLDIGLVDVLLSRGGGDWMRVFYTTNGHLDTGEMKIRPGNLRPILIREPLEDLSSYDGGVWAQNGQWQIEGPVSKWNDVLGGDVDDDTPAFRGKQAGKVGITSTNGAVFVGTGSTWVKSIAKNVGWNGLCGAPS